ncbi:MAG: hypothetical protein IJ875_05745 [Solobacterium sp.]|nr:hypothetical protein [Solobacterium sp.]
MKKSYLGLFIWLILFLLVCFSIPFFPLVEELSGRLFLLMAGIMIVVLMLIIYFTGNIYWINGMSFEESIRRGEEGRKEFAMKHLIPFSIATAIFLVFTIGSYLLGIAYWIDVVVFCVLIIGAAFSTIRVK